MSGRDAGVEEEALARLRARVLVIVDSAVHGYWGRVIAAEVELFTGQGPAEYLRHTDAMDAAASQAALDVELRRILGGGS